MDLLYFLLAALGLGFLIFIHELGHYMMARKVGMKVEVFSIGFGKPIKKFMFQGVQWQICYLILGGYVKIAGMDGQNETSEDKTNFYDKSPLKRMLVTVMGPLVNIVFALALFSVIWTTGGRERPFAENTHIIGYVDPNSELYDLGVRPGDEITSYNEHTYKNFQDVIYTSVLGKEEVAISGQKVDYFKGTKTPFSYTLKSYKDTRILSGDFTTIGVSSPASMMVTSNKKEMGKGAPLAASGIEPNDRILWAQGELIFSALQLHEIVNSKALLVTIKRDGAIQHLRVERVAVNDLELSSFERNDFKDIKREVGYTESESTYIPYAVSRACTVEKEFSKIDEDFMLTHLIKEKSHTFEKLLPGDKIMAVNGESVSDAVEMFEKIGQNKILMIVQKSGALVSMNEKNEDAKFVSSVNWNDLQSVIASLGIDGGVSQAGSMQLLAPIYPISAYDYYKQLESGGQSFTADEKKGIEQLKNDKNEYIFLGSEVHDKSITYNPSPLILTKNFLVETYRTLSALVTGHLSPKFLAGPIGIGKIMFDGWKVGTGQAMYWLALISLNLGVINLLPLPVLDGGHIMFCLYEMITRRRISPKVMEKMVLPFVVLIITFFIYVTYHDIARFFIK